MGYQYISGNIVLECIGGAGGVNSSHRFLQTARHPSLGPSKVSQVFSGIRVFRVAGWAGKAPPL